MTERNDIKEEMTNFFICFYRTRTGETKFVLGSETVKIAETDIEEILNVINKVFSKTIRRSEGEQILKSIRSKKDE